MKHKKKSNQKGIWIAAAVCAVALIAMIAALCVPPVTQQGTFTPPPFDPAAVAGTPTVEDSLGWMKVSAEGMSFSAYICGEVIVEGGKADIWFTSEADNEVWLKLRIYDADGNILGETGLIRPGEYLQSVTFDTIPANGQSIVMKLMSYEPDTYYSMGAVNLNTTAKTGG